jgi:hypothetical protein
MVLVSADVKADACLQDRVLNSETVVLPTIIPSTQQESAACGEHLNLMNYAHFRHVRVQS